MSFSRLGIGTGLMALSVMASTAQSGQLSGTVNATYARSTREAAVNDADSVLSPKATSETKQSNILINYQDLLFSKNLLRLGATYFVNRDEVGEIWNVRPIYNLDLSSAGYTYNGSYSPRKETSRLRLSNGSIIETNTYFRDWRNSISLNYRNLPTVNVSYNIKRFYDNQAVRKADQRNRYVTVQSSYMTGPASANIIYTHSRNENRIASPRTRDNYRTWQGTTGFTGSAKQLGSYSAAYSYLDSRSSRDPQLTSPLSLSHIHSIAAMVTSREVYKLSSTASYSGRFQTSKSADLKATSSDENFAGQITFAPLEFLSLSMTKNYQIAGHDGQHRINENLAFSASFTRFIRHGVDTRLNWSRTYLQKSELLNDSSANDGTSTRISSGNNYTDAVYASIAATPYRRSKLLADLSISRANRPSLLSQRYASSRSFSLSAKATRSVEGRLSATYTNQGETLDLFSSYSRSLSASATYLPGSALNCNLTYTRNDVNTVPRQANSVLGGYVGYSFRNAYTLYLNVNQRRQEVPVAGSTQETVTEKPSTVTGQLQVRLSPRSTVAATYSKATSATLAGGAGGSHTFQIIYHGQF
jgi:hypothetical protein